MAEKKKTIRTVLALQEVIDAFHTVSLMGTDVGPLNATPPNTALDLSCDRLETYEGSLASGVVNEAFSLHGITVPKLLVIYASGALTLTINGVALQLGIVGSNPPGGLLYINIGVLATLTVTNLEGSQIDYAVLVAGN